ncbi:DUF2057 family protein [Oceanobacter kriegii]|uniref:DUF2057 family protein n=1 Tax=Oceanobacter kriegii TaxID=64972 RepID=UPI0004142DA4|nr:DUF2057 family protein [Oceanobacter kriegii]
MRTYILSFFTLLTTALLAGCGAIAPLNSTDVGSGSVSVTVPSTLVVVSVNGKSVDAPNLYEGNYTLHMAEGSQRIIVRYEANWNSQGESGFIIEWPPVAIDYDFKSNGTYSLNHPVVNDQETAQALSASSPIWLQTDAEKVEGKAVVEKHEAISYVISSEAPEQVTRLDQLKDLWESSSAKDQADFLQWVKTNTSGQ